MSNHNKLNNSCQTDYTETSDETTTNTSDVEGDAAAMCEVDLTTKVVGEFGRWQLYITIMMALLKLPMAWYQLNIVFMAPPQEFWCKKPKCFHNYSDKQWRQICAPAVEEHPCLIFDPETLRSYPDIDRSMIKLVPCTKFVYDKSIFNKTIASEWDLVCSKHWLTHFSQCIMMWGMLVGSVAFGKMADKYGRRMPLLICIVQQALCSFVCSFIPNYWAFLVSWFLLALASGGAGVISFVICMEVVSGKWRTIVPVISQLPYGTGNFVLALIAHLVRDWRKLEFALAALSSIYILYWFWLPESPRWLIATGQCEKAVVGGPADIVLLTKNHLLTEQVKRLKELKY